MESKAIDIIKKILAEPYGCSRCDSGKLRDQNNEHRDDCPYLLANQLLNSTPNDERIATQQAMPQGTEAGIQSSEAATKATPQEEELLQAALSLNAACDKMWNSYGISNQLPDHFIKSINAAQRRLKDAVDSLTPKQL